MYVYSSHVICKAIEHRNECKAKIKKFHEQEKRESDEYMKRYALEMKMFYVRQAGWYTKKLREFTQSFIEV